MEILTKELQWMEKYFNEYYEAFNKIPKDKLEIMFKKIFWFYDYYNELDFNTKFDLAKLDFQKFLEAIINRYQDKNDFIIRTTEEIDNTLQVVLEPMRNGDILFYSRILQGLKKDQDVKDLVDIIITIMESNKIMNLSKVIVQNCINVEVK